MRRLLKMLMLALLLPSSAATQDLSDIVEGGLLPGWRMENGRHMAALRLTLAPGWKTYWRAPGDAGIPPHFDWTGSENVRMAKPHWPVPAVFWQNGMRSVGYEGEVTLPLEFVPDQPGQPMVVRGQAIVGVCEDICIPVTLRITADLPLSGEGAGTGAIRNALARRPMSAGEAGVGRVVCRAEPIADGLRLTVTVEMPRIGAEEQAVVEFTDQRVWISDAETRRTGNRLTAVAEMVPPEAQPFAMARDGVRLTVISGSRAVDIRGCAAG